MKFTAIWQSAADAELIRQWMQADSDVRAAITFATKEIDRRLQVDPDTSGESRGTSSRRILFMPPLVVQYEIRSQDRVVFILSVALCSK